MVLKGATGEWYQESVRQVNEQSNSRLLCQLVVLSAMKPRRLSARVILQISIWTLITIVLVFVLLYSFLLTFVNKGSLATHPFRTFHYQKENTQIHNVHKVKFRSKSIENEHYANVVNNDQPVIKITHRKMLWNSSDYYDVFTMSPKCNKKCLYTILITSSPEHFEQRTQIRNTWCNSTALSTIMSLGTVWQCVFLIGQTDSWRVDSAVDQEAGQYQDILRGAYLDSYRNLTYKVLHGLNWSSSVCPTPYILKTDDDCFVNVIQLALFLESPEREHHRLYVGSVNNMMEKRRVVRKLDSKWSVSRDSYSPDFYPPYASGTGYVLTEDMVHDIVTESSFITPIPNEDAYIGIVVSSLGVEPVSSSRFTIFSLGLRLCNYLYVLVSHSVKTEDHMGHYNRMLQSMAECNTDINLIKTWS